MGKKKKVQNGTGISRSIEYIPTNALHPKAGMNNDDGTYKALKLDTEKRLGMTPLSVVAAIGDASGTERYLKDKADPNSRCKCDNSTPLMLAAQNKHRDVVKVLLDHGADCTLINNDGNNAFMIAIRSGEAHVINAIWPYRKDLHVDHSNIHGYTALHMAAERKWECCVQFLLSNRARPNVQTLTGTTPLMLAAGKGDIKTTEKLVSAQADILIEDMLGLTAICYAQKEGRKDVEDFLLNKLTAEQRDYFIRSRLELLKHPADDNGTQSLEYYVEVLFPILRKAAKMDSFRKTLFSQKVISKVIAKQKEHLTDLELLKALSLLLCALIFKCSSTVDEQFVKQYINCKGPDLTIETLKYYTEKMRIPERDTLLYFAPMVSVVEIPEGKKWLTKHWSIVSEYANFFRQGIDSYHFLEQKIRSQVSIVWKHFYDFLFEIQKKQRDRKMAELLEQEEREKMKKERKKDKRSNKKNQKQLPVDTTHEQTHLITSNRLSENDNTLHEERTQPDCAVHNMRGSVVQLQEDHFMCEEEQVALLMACHTDNWTTVQAKRPKEKPTRSQEKKAFQHALFNTANNRRQAKTAIQRSETPSRSEAQVPGSTCWAAVAKNREERKGVEGSSLSGHTFDDQVIITAEEFPYLQCTSNKNIDNKDSYAVNCSTAVSLTYSESSLSSYAQVVRDKERSTAVIDDWWEKAPLKQGLNEPISTFSESSMQTDQVTTSSATDEDYVDSEYDNSDWTTVNSGRASGMAAACSAFKYNQDNIKIQPAWNNARGNTNMDVTNREVQEHGPSKMHNLHLPLYARKFEPGRKEQSVSDSSLLPSDRLLTTHITDSMQNKRMGGLRTNQWLEQHQLQEPETGNSNDQKSWRIHDVTISQNNSFSSSESNRCINNMHAIAKSRMPDSKPGGHLAEIAVSLIVDDTTPSESNIDKNKTCTPHKDTLQPTAVPHSLNTKHCENPSPNKFEEEEIPSWVSEPFEPAARRMDVQPMSEQFLEVYESDEEVPQELHDAEPYRTDNALLDIDECAGNNSVINDNTKKPSLHWPESWGPCPLHLKNEDLSDGQTIKDGQNAERKNSDSNETPIQKQTAKKEYEAPHCKTNNVERNSDTERGHEPILTADRKSVKQNKVENGRVLHEQFIQRPINSSLGQSILSNACAIDTRMDEVLYPSDLQKCQKREADLSLHHTQTRVEEKIPAFPSIHDDTKLSAHFDKNGISVFHKLQQLQLMQLKSYYDAVCDKKLDVASLYRNDFYYYASCTGLDYKDIYNYLGVNEGCKNEMNQPRPYTQKKMDDTKQFVQVNDVQGNLTDLPNFNKGFPYDASQQRNMHQQHCYTQSQQQQYTPINGAVSVMPPVKEIFPVTEIKSLRWRGKLDEIRQLIPKGCRKIGNIIIPVKNQTKYIITHSEQPVALGYLTDGTAVAVQLISTISRPRLEEELKRIMSLEVSPYFTVKYKDYAIADGIAYLAMELYEYTLDEYIHVLRLSQALDALSQNKLVWQLLRGLDNIHQHCHLVHGTLKPENVLLGSDGKLRLGGYGLLNDRGNTHFRSPRTLAVEKHRYWMSPEVLLEESGHTFRSDIWVAGMLIYFILSGGKHPFGSNTYDIQMNLCRNALDLTGINEEACDLLRQMMASHPNDRPSAVEAVGHPYFWAEEKRLRFILIAGSDVLRDLKAGVPIMGGTGDTMIDILSSSPSAGLLANWIPEMDPLILKEMRSFRQYKNTMVELVLFVYNCCLHFEKMSDAARVIIDEPCKYFLGRYPTLFMAVYRAIKSSIRTEKTCYRPFF